MDIDIKLQWHSPEEMFAAIFMRDGKEWYLDGALVGLDGDPGDAVKDLIELAIHLVTEGENFLTNGPISLEDRVWLFKLLDQGTIAASDESKMYLAIRYACGDIDPYQFRLVK
jgi:hypothetical protein